jgi:hypothetical protein
MSDNRNVTYTKVGAIFADAEAAKTDKNSLFSAELTQACDDCFNTMLANGVLLEPVSYLWDQDTYTLTVVKLVSSGSAYQAAVTFDVAETIRAAVSAGWTLVS